jgi:Protein of unknown function with HXXEE motif
LDFFTHFLPRNNLYLMAALGVAVASYVALNWSSMPVLANGRVILCWACDAPVGRGPFPRRGFVELITEHLHFTASSRHFGEIVTPAYVLVIAFVPLVFPRVPFLAMATMMLGVLETVMHIGMIKMFRLPRFYSPGLATAIVLLLPISIHAFA